MTHKNIRIRFDVNGRRFEAVGFLDEGENWLFENTMLERTANENGGAIGLEDWMFLCQRTSQFPMQLNRYFLAAYPCPFDGQRGAVSVFGWGKDRKWHMAWSLIGNHLDERCLVLRRCA